ncbi:MAG TPA: DMT family transporter [Acidimicrobiales bacterium]|jgi:drug/metabolite transporter (DMT)-like permease|nr:DMT family transporter [Acidimicrobiales bacterium]
MRYGTSVICAVLAAVLFALAAVMQQESTLTVATEKSLSPGLLLDLLRRPKWLVGMLSMVSGFGLQAVGLAFGPVALVQPIVVLELAFAIPFGILRRHRRAGYREWAGIAAVMAGISIFLLAANPANGVQNPPSWQWIASLVPVGGVAAVCVILGSTRQGPTRAMFLGSAAGLAFGVLAVLTKTVTHLLSTDVAKAFLSWPIYLTIGVGIVALTVSQSAYQAGPLAYSMPFVGVLEPLVAVIIGDAVLGEAVKLSETDFILELAAATVACLGILLLTTSRTVLSIYEERPEPSASLC